jgi:hypothetical protein
MMTIETDEIFAIAYLGCIETERDGVMEFTYVKPGSDQETECLNALCRLLRSREPLSTGLRLRLATLFDPDETVEARRLGFSRRRGGPNAPSDARSVAIARDIAAEINAGHGLESAVAAAVKRYKVARPTAMRAWSAHGAVYKKNR